MKKPTWLPTLLVAVFTSSVLGGCQGSSLLNAAAVSETEGSSLARSAKAPLAGQSPSSQGQTNPVGFAGTAPRSDAAPPNGAMAVENGGQVVPAAAQNSPSDTSKTSAAGQLVGLDASTLVGLDANTLVGLDANTLVGLDANTLVGLDANILVGLDANTLVGLDANTLVGLDVASALSLDREADDLGFLASGFDATLYRLFQIGGRNGLGQNISIGQGQNNNAGQNASVGQGQSNNTGAGQNAGIGQGKKPGKGGFVGLLQPGVVAKLKQNNQKGRAQALKRLEGLPGLTAKVQTAAQAANWVDNGDGTKTKIIQFTKAPKNATGASAERKIERTVRTDDNTLVSLKANFNKLLPKGGSQAMERTRVLQEDGSYAITFRNLVVNAKGQIRVTEWNKTVSPDGDVTGTGSIVVKRGDAIAKTIELRFSGNETTQTVTAEDGGVKSEVVLPAEGAPTAVVITADGNRSALPVEVSEDSTVEPLEFIERSTTTQATN